MKKITTMKGIAKHLGLSRTTVSLCLAGKAEQYRINPDTVAHVNRYVRSIGFVPNTAARDLMMQTRGLDKVALLMNRTSGSEKSMAALRFAMATLEKAGREYLLKEGPATSLVENIRALKGSGIRDVILFGPFFGIRELPDHIDVISVLFEGMNIYTVDDCFYDVPVPAGFICRMGVDRKEMCFDLFERVRKKAGGLFAVDGVYLSLEEFEGYSRKKNLPFDPALYLRHDHRLDNLFDRGLMLTDQVCEVIERLPVKFVFLFDDQVATGLINGLLDRGVRVPDDLSVIGLDNIDACPHFRVPLTSISIPVKRHVALALSKILDGEDVPPVIKSKSKIFWRDSSVRF